VWTDAGGRWHRLRKDDALMGIKPSVPSAAGVANQGLQYGIKAGVAQNELNQVNQRTPTGSLTYKTVGHNKDGTPIVRAITALRPEQQALLNTQTATNTAGATTAGNIIGANAGQWAAGPDMDETGITKALMGWGHEYLDPGFEHDAVAQDAKLANQGIMPGSEAYDNAVKARGRTRNDAYTQLLLQGQGQAQSAAEAKYMDPLRAISTLSSGAQPSVNFAQTPQAGVQAPDYAAAANNEYAAKKSNSDALLNGLFKIPTTLLGGWAAGGL
jgi:hypothetical protein